MKVPVPVLIQIPLLAPPLILPEREAVALFLQAKMSGPALTAGAGLIEIVSESEIGQVPPDVSVRISGDKEVSLLATSYCAFKAPEVGLNVPAPFVDHVPVPGVPVIEPDSCTVSLLLQTV